MLRRAKGRGLSMRVAVLQSNYIPWKGYFDIIHDVDTFVFYDDVQYTTNDWRNRNRIKTAQGVQWLTIPVGKHMHRLTCDVELPIDELWAHDHWRKIEVAYARAPFFANYRDYLRSLLLDRAWTNLSSLNQTMTIRIARDLLGISTRFDSSVSYNLQGVKSERLLNLLKQVGAREYVSGPAARNYLDEQAFQDAGIEVIWKDYSGYPQYVQLHGDFHHDVTVLDLLFHTGPDAAWHIWGWRNRHEAAA